MGVRDVSKQDVIGFSGAGLLTWLAASAFYTAFAEGLLEAAFWFYALNAFLATGAAAMVFHTVARMRLTPAHERLVPAALFVLPGLTIGLLLITAGRPLLPAATDLSLARYALFLFAAYGAVVAHAIEAHLEQRQSA
jgi:hypothetical protein